jgi:hypothetical protein
MSSPFARPLSKQDNTQTDEVRTEIHSWTGIHEQSVSAAKTFHTSYCTTNFIGHYQIESPNLNFEIKP